MAEFTVETTINAPVEHVWQALADIGSIHLCNPGVINSRLITEASGGIGAGRHCDLNDNSYLKEKVIDWEANKCLTMRITETNLPFKHADIRFTLFPIGERVRITVSPIYMIRFGIIGRILDVTYVRRTYQRGMEALLEGLKRHVEG